MKTLRVCNEVVHMAGVKTVHRRYVELVISAT